MGPRVFGYNKRHVRKTGTSTSGAVADRQLGALDQDGIAKLQELGLGPRKVLKNFRGLEVGEARPCFDLSRS